MWLYDSVVQPLLRNLSHQGILLLKRCRESISKRVRGCNGEDREYGENGRVMVVEGGA